MAELTPVDGNPFEGAAADAGAGSPRLMPVEGNPFESQSAPVPEAFIDRVARGSALTRILSKASEGAQEGAGETTPTSLSDETLKSLMDLGIFHDPAKGRASPIQFANEAMILPTAHAWDAITRGVSAGIHGAGGALGQLYDEMNRPFGGTGEQLRRETINAGNFAMIEGGMGSFSRPKIGPGGPRDQVIGGLPKDEDFKVAAQDLGSPHAETNLRDKWQDEGIHPAEAVHDAQNDAFLKHDLTTPAREPPDRSGLQPVQGSPIPQGTPRTEVAKTGEPHIDVILDSPPTKQIIDNPIIDRDHTVPYTAGGSVPLEDPTTFIDKRFPTSFTIDGVTFDPADPFTIHENIEQHVMETLIKGAPAKPDPVLDPVIDRGRAMGSPMDVARKWAEDPEGVNKQIEEIIPAIKSAERSLRQRHGVKKTEDLEDAPLSKGESDFLFYGNEHTDAEFWHQMRSQLQPVDNLKEAAQEISHELKRIPNDTDKLSTSDQLVLARLQVLFGEVGRLGGDLPTVLKDAATKYGSRFSDPEDAIFMVQTAAEKMRPLFENKPGALPAPSGMDHGTAYKVAHFEFAEKAEGAWYRAHGIDQEKAEAAYAPFMDRIQHEGADSVPGNLYKDPYPHDDPSAARQEPFAEPKPTKEEIGRAKAILADAGFGERSPASLGAAATDAPPDVPLSVQPAQPPGRLLAAAQHAVNTLFDVGRDAQMLVAPMARGTRESMAIAKDFANSLRRNRWEWSRIDTDIEKRFTPEQRKRMWDAADEESVARQLGESREHQGLVTLEPEERAAVEEMHTRAQIAWAKARDLGMVEGEGLPAYTPRLVINAASAVSGDSAIPLNGIGLNLRTRTAQMMHRAHMTAEETEAAAKATLGDTATIARDIRALPLATGKLEDAIAGRTLIQNVKDVGKRTGSETVVEGAIPAGADAKWFTVDHPAFRTWRPKFQTDEAGATTAVKDADGNVIFEQVPIYVRGDFEGPLRAVLTQKSGAAYGALMALKGKTMGLIMNSPLIHNAVEWGRAVPAMPGKVATFKVYFEGNRAKNDVNVMREAIGAGLVPIGKRFFNQDITSIMEQPNLSPGRSWTAQILGAVPGLFDEGAGNAVKRAIDKAGDFWHNTLLWDRVADLQMGLYTNFRDDLLAKSVDPQTAARAAAHWANRYAGALPQEAMSDAARKVSNVLMFSRSFTLGNLGVMKDMLTGLPKDVIAQIERDAGFRAGAINEAGDLSSPATDAVSYAKSVARRKAMSVVLADIALLYVGNSLLQSGANVLLNDRTLDEEMHGYATRLAAAMQERREHPLKLLQPLDLLQSVSATSENEPGKQDRIRIGNAKDGTAIYARNPVGKIGEEFIGYMSGPLDMMRRKLGTVARPAWQIMSNDAGFGRKVYDPDANTPDKYLKNLGLIAAHFAGSQLPEGQINAFSDLVKGEGDPKVNALQSFGPVTGVTFSKGAPGGPAVGELYHARAEHQYAVDAALPDIRRQIQRGDVDGAQERMTQLGIPIGLQRFYVRTSQNPATRLSGRSLRDFYLYATPEQKGRMENAR